MMQRFSNLLKQQKGFTLVELLVVVAIIGVLAAVAVPRFVDSTASANGAKVLADLQSLDSAIQQFSAANGALPTALTDLSTYFASGTAPTPPTGKVKIKSYESAAGAVAVYAITDGRATFGGKASDDASFR